MKATFNHQKWNEFLESENLSETVSSLDNILFISVMWLLNKENGIPNDSDMVDVTNVRYLLQNLRSCIDNNDN
jgi:hypothetical protein